MTSTVAESLKRFNEQQAAKLKGIKRQNFEYASACATPTAETIDNTLNHIQEEMESSDEFTPDDIRATQRQYCNNSIVAGMIARNEVQEYGHQGFFQRMTMSLVDMTTNTCLQASANSFSRAKAVAGR
jgi:hypothetical protein